MKSYAQIGYEAFRGPDADRIAMAGEWVDGPQRMRDAWLAAAQAIIESYRKQELGDVASELKAIRDVLKDPEPVPAA